MSEESSPSKKTNEKIQLTETIEETPQQQTKREKGGNEEIINPLTSSVEESNMTELMIIESNITESELTLESDVTESNLIESINSNYSLHSVNTVGKNKNFIFNFLAN